MGQRTIIKLFNWIYINREDTFYNEPLPFSLRFPICIYLWELSEIYNLGIEKERIIHILNEMKYFLFSQRPILHANRLLLMVISLLIANTIKDEDWTSFSDDLRENICWQRILKEEILDKNIFPINGLIAIWLISTFYNKINGEERIKLDREYYKQRIINSSFWERIQYDKNFLMNHYSLDGYCGVKLFLISLEDHII